MTDTTNLSGRVAIVTGAGAGLGRSEALALAAQGARIVVNDVGAAAEGVVAEIRSAGGDAVAAIGDIGEWSTGDLLVQTAVETLGGLDIVVNNAGVTRDKMLFNLTESDWDTVIRVHLKGHATLSRAAAGHWRQASKAADGPVYGRVINTSSEAFLLAGPGQANYAAAKAGITALTLATARGLSQYGVRANAICPRARTDMTAQVFAEDPRPGRLDILAPERVAAFVAYLASPGADRINGQVFIVYGDMVALLAPPTVETTFTTKGEAFTVDELDHQVTTYFAGRDARDTFAAVSINDLDTTGVSTPGGAVRPA